MNKNIYSLLFILCLVCPARVWAQEGPADAVPAAPDAAWLLPLDTIKASSSQLMAQNTRLTVDYHALLEEIDQLNVSIEEQGRKNAALADFLKTRHGRSDQQVRIQELERQIKASRRGASKPENELDRLRQELKVEKANEAKLEKTQ